MSKKKEERVVHQGSYIQTDVFVNDEFKYAVNNSMRNYLEFEDREELAQKMKEKLEQH